MYSSWPLTAIVSVLVSMNFLSAEEISFSLQYQVETEPGSGRFHRLSRQENWNPKETAVIVCDMWDLHHSFNAVRRVEEFAPRLNELLIEARKRGMTIIHSPSDCMEAYSNHPARKKAIQTPPAKKQPLDIKSWCSRIASEEHAVYPIDQSDGGDDDDPDEHAKWVEKLASMGRNTGTRWKTQTQLLKIDPNLDFISDRGDEVWNVLQHNGIKNVILTGVHTNMCVIGRPFGLRQMARNGINVVLARDMTDTMYNPARWPFVSHFTGTDLIVSHIERYVCPTITSDQILGGKPFTFSSDNRPHLVIVMAEKLYQTEQTLPKFAIEQLGKTFRVSTVFDSAKDPNDLVGIEILDHADIAMFSIRRRTPSKEQMKIIKRFVESGKPVVGIRSASHAFSLRGKPAPEGHSVWPEFDAQVLGGSYRNHHANELQSAITPTDSGKKHPVLKGIWNQPFTQLGSLYKNPNNVDGVDVLMIGTVDGFPAEPVAWTFTRADGGRTFYTSIGHPKDFETPAFMRLLTNGIHWAAGLPIPESQPSNAQQIASWRLTKVPGTLDLPNSEGHSIWYRCSLRLSDQWVSSQGVMLEFMEDGPPMSAWLNGKELKRRPDRKRGVRFLVDRNGIELNEANLLVVRFKPNKHDGWQNKPRIHSEQKHFELSGRWQVRIGEDPSWSNIPLPARYGTSTDIIIDPGH